MLEDSLEGMIVKEARDDGWFARKFQWVGRRAGSDHVFIKEGVVIWIEFKQKGKYPSRLQRNNTREMRAAGAKVLYCDNLRRGREILGLPQK